MSDQHHFMPAEALAALKQYQDGHAGDVPRSTLLFEHGSLEVKIYAPRGEDLQTSHTRDELYVVTSGHGEFVNGGRRHSFAPGDTIFAPAGVAHRFEYFSDDFATWVFFYGPEGGEAKHS